MLVWLFRNKQNIFISEFDVVMMKKESKELFIIPLSLRNQVLNLLHASSGTFHLGINRTQKLGEKYFIFYGINQEIEKYVQSCQQCRDGKKIESKLNPGLGQTSTNVNERLRRFSIDIVNMPPGIRGLNYLLTMVDIATGWVEIYPLIPVER